MSAMLLGDFEVRLLDLYSKVATLCSEILKNGLNENGQLMSMFNLSSAQSALVQVVRILCHLILKAQQHRC